MNEWMFNDLLKKKQFKSKLPRKMLWTLFIYSIFLKFIIIIFIFLFLFLIWSVL